VTARVRVVLDACVLLNLIASGHPLGELGERNGLDFLVVAQAEREVLWLDSEDPDRPREEVHLQQFLEIGHLTRLVLHDGELDRFVQLAHVLDDGEAATLAVAELRGFVVATDDRKALRVLTTLEPPPRAIGTAAILRAWAADHNDAEIRVCLNRIQSKASFLPPRSDPDRDWWQDHAK